jgi:hypothetical protein
LPKKSKLSLRSVGAGRMTRSAATTRCPGRSTGKRRSTWRANGTGEA